MKPRRGLTNLGRWIAAPLKDDPSDVPQHARERLASALVPLFGSDAIVWTTDVVDLPCEQNIDPFTWMAPVVVKATLADW
jgi:hypothetical protein